MSLKSCLKLAALMLQTYCSGTPRVHRSVSVERYDNLRTGANLNEGS